MEKFLNLNDLITPKFVQLLYWVLLVIAIVSGIGAMGYVGVLNGLVRIVFGIILARVGCELLIVLFKINENLQKIADKE